MKKIIAFFLVSTLVITGCDSPAVNTTTDQATESSESSRPITRFDTKVFIDKYNKYMAFSNDFHPDIVELYNDYFSWADYEKGPGMHSKKVFGINEPSSYQIKNLEEAIDSELVIEEVDGLMRSVLTASKNLNLHCIEAGSYYSKQDYKDDNFEMGQSLHKKLVADFDAYFTAFTEMEVEFAKLRDELSMHELNVFKDAGLLIKYNLLMSMNKVEGILRVIGSKNGKELKTIDRVALTQSVKEFREIQSELERLKMDEEQKTKEFGEVGGLGKGLAERFAGYGNDVIKQTRLLEERIDKNDFKYGINHKYIPDDGSPEKLEKIYSEMIEWYNRSI